MGSLLSSIIADIGLILLEKDMFSTPDFKIPFHYRYVNNILLGVPYNKIDYRNKFNNYHSRIKFTKGQPILNTIKFWNVTVSSNQNIIITTDWFNKILKSHVLFTIKYNLHIFAL